MILSRRAERPRAAFFWRRVDQPGHDSCRLFKVGDGWRLAGASVFYLNVPCHLNYEVTVDPAWRSLRARVDGYFGNRPIALRIQRLTNGNWSLGTEIQNEVAGCIDLDLGFSPATSFIVLRRMALKVGEYRDEPAACLDLPHMRLARLSRKYERIADRAYAYELRNSGYKGTLQVSPIGAIINFPGLFERIGTHLSEIGSEDDSYRPRPSGRKAQTG